MNRIDKLFKSKKHKILSVYFTAGYPALDSLEKIIMLLEKNGADMIEVGIPYSDPLADGPVIQETGTVAIANGMTLDILLLQLKEVRRKVSLPLILMGYLNPILQFGFERFCDCAAKAGADGIIIPDLPLFEYENQYKKTFDSNNLKTIFLITPDTTSDRIRQIDDLSTGFIYMVSSAATTGNIKVFDNEQINYFRRISSMGLKNPIMAGFGIHNKETINQVHTYCNGAILGSAFMRHLQKSNSVEDGIEDFFRSLKV
jgi:tryptophan synthase alpha chain